MKSPLVSVVIPAYNEEAQIRGTIASLLDQTLPRESYEIIVVDNNSTDNTWELISKLPVRAIRQPMPGPGRARQSGLEAAQGKYVLSADADVFYPKNWIYEMSQPLMQDEKIACVYSSHRFLAEPGYPLFALYCWARLRAVLVAMKSVNRPWLNCYGMSMGYRREQALEVGFDPRNFRGEDGRLAYDLTRFGRIKRVNVKVYTHVRTLKQDGGLWRAMLKRIKAEVPHLLENLRPLKERAK